jgi:heme/copper-type cytochrome/quinol oxidase subunit 3
MMQQTGSEQNLSRQELQDLRNKRTGLTIFQLSWILVFVALILVNLQIRSDYASWPPPGVDRLSAIIPTGATLALIVSGFLAQRGVQAVKQNQTAAFLSQWRLALGLGVLFVLVMVYEWLTVPVTGQYSTMFRVMTGFHGFHALVIGAYMLRVYRGGDLYNARNFWSVEAAAKLWYFVIIAWILFYTVLYIV